MSRDALTLESIEWSSGHSRHRSSEKTPVSKSVSQTALDCIVQPSSETLHSYLRWTNRFRADPEYTDEWLKVRLKELDETLLPELERLLWNPPPEWKGADWEKAWKLRERRLGQRWAIREWLRNGFRPVLSMPLETLAEDAGSSCVPGSNPFTCSEDLAQDPFAWE